MGTSVRCGGCDRGPDATPILLCYPTNFGLCLDCVVVAQDTLARTDAIPPRPRPGREADPVRCEFCERHYDGHPRFFEFGRGCVCTLCLELAVKLFSEEKAPVDRDPPQN